MSTGTDTNPAKANIRAMRAAHREELDLLWARRRTERATLCAQSGGHDFTEWLPVLRNPILGVVTTEERVCTACGCSESRELSYRSFDTSAFPYLDFNSVLPVPRGRGVTVEIAATENDSSAD